MHFLKIENGVFYTVRSPHVSVNIYVYTWSTAYYCISQHGPVEYYKKAGPKTVKAPISLEIYYPKYISVRRQERRKISLQALPSSDI